MNSFSLPVAEEEHALDEEPAAKTINDESPVLEFSKSKVTTDSTDDQDQSTPEEKKASLDETYRWSPDHSPNPFNRVKAKLVSISMEKVSGQNSP